MCIVSSSSGEIKDDSDGEVEDVVRIAQSDATKNGYVEYRRREPERDLHDNREHDVPQRFDPNNDYRHPHLLPEQISLRVRKIPPPDVLVELNDIGLRHLLSDVHELDREQIRLYNNRRRLLEQMRQMHKQELGSLRDCMETLKRLMSERGMNLLATHIGQDVMEFLHEKDHNFGVGSIPLATNIQASSSEPCHGSYGVFPKTQSFAQNTLPSRPNFVSERSSAFSYPPVVSTVSGPLILPPPDFSVPPPFPGHSLQAGNDQTFEGPGTSTINTRDVSATSSLSVPSLCSSIIEAGTQNPLRNVSLVNTNERPMEMASGSNNHIPSNGTMVSEKIGRLEFRPKLNRDLNHPGMLPGIPQQPPQPPMMGMMRAQQRFGVPSFRDSVPIMDNSRGAPFIDERGLSFPNSRIVSLYDDGRLPFHEYEHPQGDEAIRIRHVWSTRPSATQRRMLQQGVFRDRKIQRAVAGTFASRNYGEMRDRSRSPRGGPKSLVANSSCETGATTTTNPNIYATHTSSNNAEENVMLIDENSEPGTDKISQS
ncbi:unnamed protein product [Onchocerca ochengi]|uniref:PUM-HD domain-containing protein n=1 Tax=Onchocerca ochengi TaxID=42157 RepID=A0A182E9W3_ONCOC|nr:unnamed protein product [Onchocerca ochengi]